MPRNDSDSSDGGEESFTTTNVMLGYASKELTDDDFSQLGGYPTWLDETKPPSAGLAKCKICNHLMTLLLQLNGDLPERFPGHERKLYIFTCRRKACRRKEGSMRAIRSIRISKDSAGKPNSKYNCVSQPEEPKKAQPPTNLGDTLFKSTFSSPNTSNQNPFSTNVNDHSLLANPFSPRNTSNTASPFSPPASKPPQNPSTDLAQTFAQKARISSPSPSPVTKEPWPPQSSFPKPYPSYNLDADYETLDPTPPSSVLKPAMDLDGGISGSKDDEKEAFESTIDKTFQRFADRLAQNPQQILRYEFGGSPLLYSKTDFVGKIFSHPLSTSANNRIQTISREGETSRIARCPNCTAPRVFELQLVPQAIAELEAEEDGLEGMEWGTVILGVCGNDCGERGVKYGELGWVEEWLGVQWEEDAKPGKG